AWVIYAHRRMTIEAAWPGSRYAGQARLVWTRLIDGEKKRRESENRAPTLEPTAVSNVALAACNETSHVCSPTSPSAVTPPHFWNALTEAAVAGPKFPSIAPGGMFHWPEAPFKRIFWRLLTIPPVERS